MGSLAAWLGALAGPLAAKALISLGFGFVSFVGVKAAIDGLVGLAQSSLVGLPPEIAAICARFGFFSAMGIITGGIVSGLVFIQLKRLSSVTTGT